LATCENATYNCSREKHEFSRSSPYICIDYPCVLLLIMANAKGIENCKLLNWIGESDGVISIKTCSTLNLLFIIVDSTTFLMIFLTTNRVPLHSRDGFMILNKIIGEPIFNCKLCSIQSRKSKEFKNSVGKF